MATKVKSAKKATVKTRAQARSVTRPRKALSDSRPVTLDEARAMVHARQRQRAARTMAGAPQPRRAARRSTVAAAAPATPATVGAERERLEKQRREERTQRKREYKAMMEIMKQRGVRRSTSGVAAKRRRRAPGATAASFTPLQVLAEGDSWFEYPVPFFGGGIIKRLENRVGVPILNMADAGDEVRYMLGVEQRKRLVECLTEGSPAGGSWDVLLFSGGGNDIVDNPMALWVRDWNPAIAPAAHINQPRFDAALALVRAGYEDLISLRDTLSPGTHLIFHGYDFAIPDGRGFCHLGPWLKPCFDFRNFSTRDAGFAVLQAMLKQFAAILTALAAAHPKVTFINGQGTLAPKPSSWHNELHPDKAGFEKFAGLFYQQLKHLFPGRVA
jgi:hypothetical protein